MASVSNSNSNQIFYLFPPKEELEALLNSKVKEAFPSLTAETETIAKICKIAANIFGPEEGIPAKALSERLWDYKTKSDEDLIDELKVQGITDQKEIDDFINCFSDLVQHFLEKIGKDYAAKNPEKLELQKVEELFEERLFNVCASKAKVYIDQKEDQKLKRCLMEMYYFWKDHGREFVTENFSQIANNELIFSLRKILEEQTINKDIICNSLIGIKDPKTYKLLIEKLDSSRITKLFYETLGSTNPENLEEVITSPLFSWDNIDCKEFVDRLGAHTRSTNRGWTDLIAQILLYDQKFISFLKKLETKKEFEDFIKTIVHPYLEKGHDSEIYGWFEKIDTTISPYFSWCLANQLFSSAIDYPLNIPETLVLATRSASSNLVIAFLCKLAEKANQSETTPAKRKDLEKLGKLIISKLPQLSLIRFAADSLKGTNLDNEALVKWILESEEKKHLDGLINTREFWKVCLEKKVLDLNRYLTLIRYFPVSNSQLEEIYKLSKKHKNIPAIKAIFMNLDSEETKKRLVDDFVQWFTGKNFDPSDFEAIAPYLLGSQMISLIDPKLLCNFLQKLDPETSKVLLTHISIEHIQDEKVLKVILDLACDFTYLEYTKKVYSKGIYISKTTTEELLKKWAEKLHNLTKPLDELKGGFYEEFKKACTNAGGINFLKTYARKALDKESFFELSDEQLRDIIRNANPEVFNILLQRCMKYGKKDVVKAILDANASDQNLRAWASYCAVFYGDREYVESNLFDLELARSCDSVRMYGGTYNADELLLKRCMKYGNTDTANAILDANAADADKYNSLRGLASHWAIFYGHHELVKSDWFDFKLALSKGSNFPNGKLEKAVQVARQNNLLSETERRELALYAFENISLEACLAFCSNWNEFKAIGKVGFETQAIREKLMIEVYKYDDPDLLDILARAYLESFPTFYDLVDNIFGDACEINIELVFTEALEDHLKVADYDKNDIERALSHCIECYDLGVDEEIILRAVLSSKSIQNGLNNHTLDKVILDYINKIIDYNDRRTNRRRLDVILSSKSIQNKLSKSTVSLIEREGKVRPMSRGGWDALAEFQSLCHEHCPHLRYKLGIPEKEEEEEEEEQYRDNDFSPMPFLGHNQIIAKLERQKQTNNERNTNSGNTSRRPNSNLSFSRPSAIQTNSGRGVPAAPAASHTRSSNTSTSRSRVQLHEYPEGLYTEEQYRKVKQRQKKAKELRHQRR